MGQNVLCIIYVPRQPSIRLQVSTHTTHKYKLYKTQVTTVHAIPMILNV